MNFVILGGGTAGWLTALFVRKVFPNSNITLIQSPDIGIIGVGEATTPNLCLFLSYLNISISDVINETNGTIKCGISFENWNGDNKKYFHPFLEKVSDFKIENIFTSNCEEFYVKNIIDKKLPLEEYLYHSKLAYGNKVDIDNTFWALHFDATLFAIFLEKIGRQRNINVIEGEYENAVLDEQGKIKSVYLKDTRKVEVDFIFDCSGFNRLLIGKLYNQKWTSYSKHLPMKKAIPFWMEHENVNDIQPYTTSIAMKYGWIWKIPLQNRVGAGYIFDSNYIDENQALEEAEKYFNRKLSIRKIINFDAGKYENFWVKNCIAVGLSSSFIEPLESTSLFLSIGSLDLLKYFLNDIQDLNEHSIKLYNEIVSNNMSDTLDFIYLHYMTKRNDSDFWKNFKRDCLPTERISQLLPLIKSGNLRYFDVLSIKTPTSFPVYSMWVIANGLELIENNLNIKNHENLIPTIDEYKEIIDSLYDKAMTHNQVLSKIRGY